MFFSAELTHTDRIRPINPGHPLPRALVKHQRASVTLKMLTPSFFSNLHLVPAVVSSAQESVHKEVESIAKLSDAASKYPYYKYNGMWTRHIQDAVSRKTSCSL